MAGVFGAYELLKPLGRGSAGSVYAARLLRAEPGIPSLVALKVMHESRASDPESLARFRHEAEIATAIESPHVATVYDTGRVGGALYIAMELIHGWPLTKYLARSATARRKPAIEDTVAVFAGGLLGLHAIHTALHSETGEHMEVVHRDVSPKNLMIARDASMRVIDLGLGRSQLKEWETRAGLLLGTPGYMAPEVVLRTAVDHRADLYAMGIILFEMLTVHRFHRRAPLAELLKASASPKVRPPSVLRPDIPPALDDVVMKALQPKPERRFQSATEFLDALVVSIARVPDRERMVAFLDDVLGDPLDPDIGRLARKAAPSAITACVPAPRNGVSGRTDPVGEVHPAAPDPGGEEETVIFSRRSVTSGLRRTAGGDAVLQTSEPRPAPPDAAWVPASIRPTSADVSNEVRERAPTVFDPRSFDLGARATTRRTPPDRRMGRALRLPKPRVSLSSMLLALIAGTCTGGLVARFVTHEGPMSGPKGAVESRPSPARGGSVQALTEELVLLGATVKSRRPERSGDVDGILSEVPLQAGSPDVERVRERLEAARRRLEALLDR